MPALSSQMRNRIYAHGIGAHLPFSALRNAVGTLDALATPQDWLARRKAANALLRNSPWRGYAKKSLGYALVSPDTIPGLADATAHAAAIVRERRAEVLANRTGLTENNPFYMILQDREAALESRLVEFALSTPLVSIAADYLGVLPRLQNINLWLAQPLDQKSYGSQLFHLDKPDVSLFSLFVNVSSVTTENGPLTFLPADRTDAVRRAASYDATYYRGTGRLPDEELFRHCKPRELVELTGPAGTGGFVDTSRCLHIGSRCRAGERVTLVIRYAPVHKTGGVITKHLPKTLAGEDPLRRLLLAN